MNEYNRELMIPQAVRPEGNRIYRADNQDSDWRNGLIGLATFALTSGVVYFASGSAALAIGLYLFLAFFTVLSVMGITTTLWATGLEAWNENKWANVEKERILGVKAVLLSRSREIIEKNAQDHELEMTKLTHDKTLLSLQEDVAHLLAESSSAPSHNYVNNKREPMLIDIELWLRELYATPGSINDSGTVAVKLPWNERWTSKPWRDEAQKILTRGDFSPIVPVINEKTGKPSHHYVRYEELNDAIKQVKRG